MAVHVPCCLDETPCPGCGAPLCPDNPDQDVVLCEVEGEYVCLACHGTCVSVLCAGENDPTDPHDE